MTYALLNKNAKYASLTISYKYESVLQSCSSIVMPSHRKFATATSYILGKKGGGVNVSRALTLSELLL